MVDYKGVFTYKLIGHRNLEITAMAHHFMVSFLLAFAHALTVHGCAEAIRIILGHFVPRMSPLLCLVLGLTAAVALVEVAGMRWLPTSSVQRPIPYVTSPATWREA